MSVSFAIKKKYTASECVEIMCFQTVCHHINEKMNASTEQRYVKELTENVETNPLLKKAFQNEFLHNSTIHRWHGAFMNSRESAKIESRRETENCRDRCQCQYSISSD